jgi:hypothetical protein
MKLQHWIDLSTPLPGAPGVRRLNVVPDAWQDCAKDVAAGGGRLLALWADYAGDVTVFAALIAGPTVLVLALELPGASSTYPSLADVFPAAARMQRAAADLCGVRARDFDQRPWLRHAAWRADYLPLLDETPPAAERGPVIDNYSFTRVAVVSPNTIGCTFENTEANAMPSPASRKGVAQG